jgi:FixJ family two-component response regulator
MAGSRSSKELTSAIAQTDHAESTPDVSARKVRRTLAKWRMLPLVDSQEHIVFIVDDDGRIRDSLSALLATFNLNAITFGSAADYLAYPKPDVPGCLILDVDLPDIDRLDLQGRAGQGNCPQIVFLTGNGDIPASMRAIKVIDSLTRPFKDADLMKSIHAALAHDRDARRKRAELAGLHQRLSHLTTREREVLPLVVGGALNKQAASELGISESTVQIHRGKIMLKMGAESLAELERMAGWLDIPPTPARHAHR